MDKYIIDGHKLFWHMDRVNAWQNCETVAPIYVEVSPVSLCNHRCIFCGIDFVRDRDVRLDSGIFIKRIGEMGRLGVRSMMFAGEGEPLLHKDIAAFVRKARSSGIDVSMTSNGALGNKNIWSDLLPDLTWIRFSVDAGNPTDYEAVHRVPRAIFDKTVKSIESAVRVKKDKKLKTTIGIQFLIIEENIGSIKDAIKIFSDMGVDYFSLKPYSLHPQMEKRKNVLYTEAIMKTVQAVVGSFKNKSSTDIIFRKDAMGKYMARDMKFDHCRALPFWGYISSRGDFYTCSVFIGDSRFRAGNIYEEDMKKIFFGNRRERSIVCARQTLNIKKECRLNCRMARINEFLEFLEKKPDHINFI